MTALTTPLLTAANVHISPVVILKVRASIERQALSWRLTRMGICDPCSGALRSNGRCTIVDLFMMSCAGTASSNSNARTSVKRRAFILRTQQIRISRAPRTAERWHALDKAEPIPNTRPRPPKEREHVAPHSGNAGDGLGRVLPSLGSTVMCQRAHTGDVKLTSALA